MPKLHFSVLNNLIEHLVCTNSHPCAESLHITKLKHGIHTEATYTAGEGFLTSCLDFLTILIAGFPEETILSTIFSRLCVPLAEGSVLVSKSSPESVLGLNLSLPCGWRRERERRSGRRN